MEKGIKYRNTTLKKAMKEFKLNKGLVLTDELEGEEEADGLKIEYMPLWKWLLGD